MGWWVAAMAPGGSRRQRPLSHAAAGSATGSAALASANLGGSMLRAGPPRERS